MNTNSSMSTLDAILSRRSVRSFESTPLNSEQIEAILKAAMHAPSAGNAQPWRFVVVDDKKFAQRRNQNTSLRANGGRGPACYFGLWRFAGGKISRLLAARLWGSYSKYVARGAFFRFGRCVDGHLSQ